MKVSRPPHQTTSGTRVLNRRYELLDVLGAGGMGTVHRARDLRLGRDVAVKILRTSAHEAGDHRRRLAAEATIAASLRHPSIAQVFDHDEDQDSPDRTPFVVMELIEGVTLAQLLRDREALPWEQALAIVREIATALDHLQAHGVVHRDLKPANIMLTTDHRVVLVDFGIARGSDSTAMTTTGALLGTVEFLSPEQIGGASATASSDLYALGLVAHACLTGTSPFRRSSHIATAWAQINDDLPELPESVPPVVRGLVTSLAAKASVDRPADAATVVRTISGLGLALELPQVGAEDLRAAHQPTTTSTVDEGTVVAAPFGRQRPRWATAASAAAVALVVAMLLGGEKSPSVAEAPDTPVAEESAPTETDPIAGVPSAESVVPEPETVTVVEAPVVEPVAPEPVAPTGNRGNGNASKNGNGNAGGNGNGNGKAK